ncbi:YfbU family protein [Trueperella pyogenes]|uniref:YfbU family protein n=1 Tax=Trueperella pyogenes TaxID=1661 RepID=UPI00345CC446
MATLTIRIDESVKRDMEVLAAARSQTVSELLRTLIDDELGYREQDDDSRPTFSVAPVTMSSVDRKILSMLHHIRADQVGEVEADDGAKKHQLWCAHVLEQGFTASYGEVFASLCPELPMSDCDFVMDVFDMFTACQGALAYYQGKGMEFDAELTRRLEFLGFDFNDGRESAMASYGEMLTKEGRWPSMAKYFEAERESGNSHRPVADDYVRMLEVYEQIKLEKSRESRGFACEYLTVEELQRIGDARVHPSRRPQK